jgi:hypothetical protein
VLLHLQQICSKISLSGCKVELTRRWTNRPFSRKGPLFLLFLQEIISDGPSFAAGILDCRRRGKPENSETTLEARPPSLVGEREMSCSNSMR